ncbi:Ferrochelatase [Luteitalea pratensis]|uniref:Ferrochelatase n=1 Tax=Luteitalea pratensis TaxID=1855912 RepID=A0A143PJ48_LUTPR|nr:ferrochelatase [Luteitalea pratensis]AMY08612.1 Ferrochelatase [Luteitalea pratensis]
MSVAIDTHRAPAWCKLPAPTARVVEHAFDAPPVGVLLFNMGGPGTLDEVEPFLVNLFSDRDIIELPMGALLQPVVARIIARARGNGVRRNYASIGGGSPQLRLTRAQALALNDRLDRVTGRRHIVEIAMRYWQPDTDTALQRLASEGVSRLVTVTLYPHYSRATTGSSRRELDRVLAQPQWQGRFDVSHVDAYPDHPLYLDAMADNVRRALDGFPSHRRNHVTVLFSAHGLPRKFVDEGDPYVEHTHRTVQGILGRVAMPNRHAIGFQSRTGPVTWIGPGTEEVLRDLGRQGVKEVLMVPVSFVSDHIETLYEVDQLFKDDAMAAGILDYRRSEALNTHPLYIEALVDLVGRQFAVA